VRSCECPCEYPVHVYICSCISCFFYFISLQFTNTCFSPFISFNSDILCWNSACRSSHTVGQIRSPCTGPSEFARAPTTTTATLSNSEPDWRDRVRRYRVNKMRYRLLVGGENVMPTPASTPPTSQVFTQTAPPRTTQTRKYSTQVATTQTRKYSTQVATPTRPPNGKETVTVVSNWLASYIR